MQMFDDAHLKRPKKEKAVEVEIEQAPSETDSADSEGDREEVVQAGKAEEVIFQSTR